jgi:hypothetical protein
MPFMMSRQLTSTNPVPSCSSASACSGMSVVTCTASSLSLVRFPDSELYSRPLPMMLTRESTVSVVVSAAVRFITSR